MMFSFLATFGRFCGGKLGSKILFSTTCHLQTYGQSEIVNMNLTQLLRAIIKINFKIRKIVCHLLNLYIIEVCILLLIIHYLRLFMVLILNTIRLDSFTY
jgi:hypothetical protein